MSDFRVNALQLRPLTLARVGVLFDIIRMVGEDVTACGPSPRSAAFTPLQPKNASKRWIVSFTNQLFSPLRPWATGRLGVSEIPEPVGLIQPNRIESCIWLALGSYLLSLL